MRHHTSLPPQQFDLKLPSDPSAVSLQMRRWRRGILELRRAPGELRAEARQHFAIKKPALVTSRARSTGNGRSVSFANTLSIVRFKIEAGSTLKKRCGRWRGSHIHPWAKVGRVYFGEVRGGLRELLRGILELLRAPGELRAEEVDAACAKLREQRELERCRMWTQLWNKVQKVEADLAKAKGERQPEITE